MVRCIFLTKRLIILLSKVVMVPRNSTNPRCSTNSHLRMTWRLLHCSVLTFEMQSLSYGPFLAVTGFSDTIKTCEATAKRIDGSRGKSGSDGDSTEGATTTKLLGLHPPYPSAMSGHRMLALGETVLDCSSIGAYACIPYKPR